MFAYNRLVYYSFKIFRRFRLAQILRLILHNQLTWSKFGRRFKMTATVRKSDGNREVLGRGCVSSVAKSFGRPGENGGTFYTFCEEEIAELLPKNMAKTAKEQLHG